MRTESVIANIFFLLLFFFFWIFFFFLTFSPSCHLFVGRDDLRILRSKLICSTFPCLFSLRKTKAKLKLHSPFPFFYPPAEMLGLFMKTVTAQDSVVCGVEEGSLLGNIRPPYSGEGPPLVSFFSLFVFCCKTKRAQPLFPTAECRLKWLFREQTALGILRNDSPAPLSPPLQWRSSSFVSCPAQQSCPNWWGCPCSSLSPPATCLGAA